MLAGQGVFVVAFIAAVSGYPSRLDHAVRRKPDWWAKLAERGILTRH